MGPGFLAFFILGWAYYMASTILMKGSIFIGMRDYIGKRAEEEKFFRFLHGMIGCLMCTATEAALWTLGVTTLILGSYYHLINQILSDIFQRPVDMPFIAEFFLMLLVSIALSLAVAGEAWAIQSLAEHRERKFLALRDEFRAREIELLGQINTGTGKENNDYEFDLEVR